MPTCCSGYGEDTIASYSLTLHLTIGFFTLHFSLMTTFTIQPYTKKELALLYFPSATPHVAVNHLMSWIRRCKPLHDALVDQGYRKTTKWLSPHEVKLITEYLGEP